MIILFLAISCTQQTSKAVPPGLEKGILDLRNYDFDQKTSLILKGEWYFYWNDFIDPAAEPDESPLIIELPHYWKEKGKVGDTLISRYGYASYQVVLLFDEENIGEEVELSIPEVGTAYRCYVDGSLIAGGGTPGKSKKESVPQFGPCIKEVKISGTRMNIVFHVSNYHYEYGGLYWPVKVSKKGVISKKIEFYGNVIHFSVGIFIVMFLYHLCIFLLDRHQKPALLFACYAFVSAITLYFFNLFKVYELFPAFPFELLVKLQYFPYISSILFVTLFTILTFPDDFPKNKLARHINIGYLSIYLFSILITPAIVYSRYAVYASLVYSLIFLPLVIYTAIKAIINKREGAVIFFLGIFSISAFIILDRLNDILNFFTFYLGQAGLILFVFSQAILLLRRYNRAFADVRHLSEELENNNIKLHHLNENLEEIIRLRTIKLEESNEKLRDLDRVKTNFFANISHELRTPLTLILSPLESLLSGDYGSPPLSNKKIQKVFSSMHTNSVRLFKLINNLLDFSKIEAGKMKLNKKITDLNRLLHFYTSSVNSGIESRGMTLDFIARKKRILVALDRDLIEKAFFNLLSNALKFSREGGTISIELDRTEQEILIKVKDQGIGIPSDKLEVIFERFSQVEGSASRKYEGTGIGLAFTREIIELHHGTIRVESEMGKGSTFLITLPCSTEVENEYLREEDTADFHEVKNWLLPEESAWPGGGPEEPETLPESAPGKEQESVPAVNKSEEVILIVDDNSSMRSFIKSLLEKKYTIITARNGKQALEIVGQKKPDLIVSDVMMPGIDGLELCRILKEDEATSGIPLILLTARMDLTTRLKGLSRKADDYLLKPFNGRELFVRIENLLEKRRLEQHLQATTHALWSEMETARQIQSSLLPKNPVIRGFDIACYIQSASEVSGDYYDVITMAGKSWLVIGDVSGHGITAGLVMMMVQTAINIALDARPELSPAGLLTLINRTIKQNISKLGQEKFMTISVFAIIDQPLDAWASNEAKRNDQPLDAWASNKTKQAGTGFVFSGLHQDIYIYRKKRGTVEVLESQGMWIGFIPDISHLVKDDAFELEKGDTLLLYTDGITEAVRKETAGGKSRIRFGYDKLLKLFEINGHKKPEDIKSVLRDELSHYVCDDDFTFVIVQRK